MHLFVLYQVYKYISTKKQKIHIYIYILLGALALFICSFNLFYIQWFLNRGICTFIRYSGIYLKKYHIKKVVFICVIYIYICFFLHYFFYYKLLCYALYICIEKTSISFLWIGKLLITLRKKNIILVYIFQSLYILFIK